MARNNLKKVLSAAALFGGAVAAVAIAGSVFNPSKGDTAEWFDSLEKPSFNPPNLVFAPVWTLLYVLIAISGARVSMTRPGRERTAALMLWAAQLILNGAWSPLFFGAKRPDLSLLDIMLLVPAIGAYIAKARRLDKPAAALVMPYLAWVLFATLLNAEFVRLNRD
jgi:benzodiazapine receptor